MLQNSFVSYVFIVCILIGGFSQLEARSLQKNKDILFGDIYYRNPPITITMVGNGSLTASGAIVYTAAQVQAGSFSINSNTKDTVTITVGTSANLSGNGNIVIDSFLLNDLSTYNVTFNLSTTRLITGTLHIPNNSFEGDYSGGINVRIEWKDKNGNITTANRVIPILLTLKVPIYSTEISALNFGTILAKSNTDCVVSLKENNVMQHTCEQVTGYSTGVYNLTTTAALEETQIYVSSDNTLTNSTGGVITTSNEKNYVTQTANGYRLEVTADLAIASNTPSGDYTGNIYINVNY